MNKRRITAILVGILSLITGIFAVRLIWFSPEQTLPDLPPVQNQALTGKHSNLSGPFSYKNLSVYLIHGDDVLKEKTPLTLEEAMKKKVVIVHETEEVNELAIENISRNEEVYVQAGDIVKGGKQDRVLTVDLIVPANSGRLPIDSFCVEQGRWNKRGDESSDRFTSASEYVSSKDLKIAAKINRSQQEVWSQVAASQHKLSEATNANTSSDVSRSSLQLTLENANVREDSEEYINALSSIVSDSRDAIGFVLVLNGEINSADTYGSTGLFIKLWPKLLKAGAIEAVAESYREYENDPASIEEIGEFLETAENSKMSEERNVTKRIRISTRESESSVYIESEDRGVFLHGSYIMR